MITADAPSPVPTKFPVGFKARPRYPGTCCKCYEQSEFAIPFTMLRFGWNTAHGTCPRCGAALHLMLNIKSEHLLSEPHDLYLKDREAPG